MSFVPDPTPDEARILAIIGSAPDSPVANLMWTQRHDAIVEALAQVRAETVERCLRAVNIASLTGDWGAEQQAAFHACARAIHSLRRSNGRRREVMDDEHFERVAAVLRAGNRLHSEDVEELLASQSRIAALEKELAEELSRQTCCVECGKHVSYRNAEEWQCPCGGLLVDSKSGAKLVREKSAKLREAKDAMAAAKHGHHGTAHELNRVRGRLNEVEAEVIRLREDADDWSREANEAREALEKELEGEREKSAKAQHGHHGTRRALELAQRELELLSHVAEMANVFIAERGPVQKRTPLHDALAAHVRFVAKRAQPPASGRAAEMKPTDDGERAATGEE